MTTLLGIGRSGPLDVEVEAEPDGRHALTIAGPGFRVQLTLLDAHVLAHVVEFARMDDTPAMCVGRLLGTDLEFVVSGGRAQFKAVGPGRAEALELMLSASDRLDFASALAQALDDLKR
jgi:hypothetical protein